MNPINEFFELLKECDKFHDKLTEKVLLTRNELISSKNQHISDLNNLKHEENRLMQEIKSIMENQKTFQNDITANNKNLKQQVSKVEELKLKQQALIKQKESIEVENNEIIHEIKQLNEKLEKMNKNLEIQHNLDFKRLSDYEKYLGLTINYQQGKLRFTFINIDSNDIDKEFFIDIIIEDDYIKVVASNPPIDSSDLGGGKISRPEDFKEFLKNTRKLFKKSVQ